jgi:basic membrane lipoprotein Med (substrate-binding protein (PBP1-ABC) superfamily)/DNA-binding SARP family transcriptional activator
LDFLLFGSLEARSDERAIDLGPPKQRALLAILLLHVGEIVPVDQLTELLWGDNAPRTAAHSIQVYVSDLRKVLEPLAKRHVIITRPSGYILETDPNSIDVVRFERLVGEGTRAITDDDRLRGEEVLRWALDLWRGQPLSDFSYDDFAAETTRRLESLRLDAVEGLAELELDNDRPQEALRFAEDAISTDPLREFPRRLSMIALYRLGRHPEALSSFQRFRSLLADELGLDPSPELRQLYERMLLHDPALVPERTPSSAIGVRNPYKGLRPFEERDAEDFFGRDDLVAVILARLASGERLLALIGPSGCGKSSVVHAGVLPALRAQKIDQSELVIARMEPGLHPFQELETALSRAAPDQKLLPVRVDEDDEGLLRAARKILPGGRRLLLVIDQFEEIFSQPDDSVTASFLRSITIPAAQGEVIVLLTLRADFYDRPLANPDFAPLFTSGVVNVLPLTATEIEAAVTGPARKVGVEVQPAVLAALVADTSGQVAALPLLQYALTELFELRTGSALTLQDYEKLGGLQGLLSRRAEELFIRLDEEKQQVAFQLFARLVQVGESSRPIRSRISVAQITELGLDPIALSIVLSEFGRYRLVSFDRDRTTGDPTVEVAHESLFWEWDRFADWIERYKEEIKRHRALTVASGEWEASDRDPDFLITGSRLTALENWSRETALRLSSSERLFLSEALDRRREQEIKETAARNRQEDLERRASRRLRALAVAIVLLAAIGTFGVLSWLNNRPPEVVFMFDRTTEPYASLYDGGFTRAAERFDVDAERSLTTLDDLESELRAHAERGVEVVIVAHPPPANEIVDDVARDHPDTRFVTFDQPGDRPNVSYVTFAEEEGSFLAGAAAALKSDSGIIGFMGGVDFELIWRFEAGFEAGARAVDPDIKILTTYLTKPPDFGGFSSPSLAVRRAGNLYGEGADVIYHAAGSSGFGLFEAARAQSRRAGTNHWAIGVDVDQYQEVALTGASQTEVEAWQKHILTSMVKRYDQAVFEVLGGIAKDELRPGMLRLDLESGGVGLAHSGGYIEDIRSELNKLEQRVVSDEIKIPKIPTNRNR